MYLIVNVPFGIYNRGDQISDPILIAQILAGPYAPNVVEVNPNGFIPPVLPNFVIGFLALGTGSTTFVEMVGSGYSRQAITMSPIKNGETANQTAATFSATGTWPQATQIALCDGNNAILMWWANQSPFTLTNGISNTVAYASVVLSFPDLVAPPFASIEQYASGTQIGNAQVGTPITAYSALQVASGILSVYAGGAVTSVGGQTGAVEIGPLATATPGPGMILNDGTVSVTPITPFNVLGGYNPVTNTPSIAAGGGGVGSGNGNAYFITVAGSTSIDSLGSLALGDYIIDVGGTHWSHLPLGSALGTLSQQNANNINATGGSITGQSVLGFSNGDTIMPASGVLPDYVDYVTDDSGNIVEATDYAGNKTIGNLQVPGTFAVPGTAGIATLSIANTQTYQAGAALLPDLIDYVADASGNINEATDATGTKIFYNLQVINSLTYVTAPGLISNCPGDALDITHTKYGAVGDGRDDVFLGTWTSGAGTLTVGKYAGAATWSAGNPIVLGAITGGQGGGFDPRDVGSYIYVSATDGSGVAATVQITGWNSATSVNVSADPSATVTTANIVWPAFISSDVGKAIRVEGGATSLSRQNYNNGLVPWVGKIATVVNGGQVTVTGPVTTFGSSNVGNPTRVSWGTDNTFAYLSISADVIKLGKRVIWHPATYGQAKTVYCAFALAQFGFGENHFFTFSGDPSAALNNATFLGDESVIGMLTDASGRQLYRTIIPIGAPDALSPRRDLIGRIHLPRLGATSTPAVMEVGDSLATYDPTGQSLAWSQINLFESNLALDNPGKTISFTNKAIGGTGFWDLVDPTTSLPWVLSSYDTFYLGSHGRNDAWRIHPLPIQSALNLVAALPADTHGNLPDVIFSTADAEPANPNVGMAYSHEATMFGEMLIRSLARVNHKGLIDISWPSEQAMNGTDEMHRELVQIPQVSTAFTLAAATPFQMAVEVSAFSGTFSLTSSSGSALWTAVGALSFALSPMPGNVLVLDNDPANGRLRVEPRVWGNSVTTVVSTSGSTLTTTAGTSSTGTLVWISDQTQMTHSGAPFTGSAGQCMLLAGLGLNGANERTFVNKVINSTTAVTDDFWWGAPAGPGINTYNASSTVTIGGMQFIAADAVAQVDVVMTWGTSNVYRGKITGFVNANTVTLTPTPPSLTGQTVTFWLGQTMGAKTTAAIAASSGSATQTFSVSLVGTELSVGVTNGSPGIYRGHVGRWGNKFYPRISVSGAGSVSLTASNLFADKPVYYRPVGTPYELWGTSTNASQGGGAWPHPASLTAVRSTQRAMDAADFCAN